MSPSASGDDNLPSEVEVTSNSDVYSISRRARHFAGLAGLSPSESEEVLLITTELATNLKRYARGGRLRFSVFTQDGKKILQIESLDSGPGIENQSLALEDGFSTGGNMGSGLPSIQRLADRFHIETSERGTHVTVQKWNRT